jgi:hypothetical protein
MPSNNATVARFDEIWAAHTSLGTEVCRRLSIGFQKLDADQGSNFCAPNNIPACVVGPVLLSALRRFASTCLIDVIAIDCLPIALVWFRPSRFSKLAVTCRILSGFRQRVRFQPECAGRHHRVDASFVPPRRLVAMSVQVTMMSAA